MPLSAKTRNIRTHLDKFSILSIYGNFLLTDSEPCMSRLSWSGGPGKCLTEAQGPSPSGSGYVDQGHGQQGGPTKENKKSFAFLEVFKRESKIMKKVTCLFSYLFLTWSGSNDAEFGRHLQKGRTWTECVPNLPHESESEQNNLSNTCLDLSSGCPRGQILLGQILFLFLEKFASFIF